MTTNEYNGLKKAADALRKADYNFFESHNDEIMTPEQNELFKNLVRRLDDLYAEVYALLDEENDRRNEPSRRLSVAG